MAGTFGEPRAQWVATKSSRRPWLRGRIRSSTTSGELTWRWTRTAGPSSNADAERWPGRYGPPRRRSPPPLRTSRRLTTAWRVNPSCLTRCRSRRGPSVDRWMLLLPTNSWRRKSPTVPRRGRTDTQVAAFGRRAGFRRRRQDSAAVNARRMGSSVGTSSLGEERHSGRRDTHRQRSHAARCRGAASSWRRGTLASGSRLPERPQRLRKLMVTANDVGLCSVSLKPCWTWPSMVRYFTISKPAPPRMPNPTLFPPSYEPSKLKRMMFW